MLFLFSVGVLIACFGIYHYIGGRKNKGPMNSIPKIQASPELQEQLASFASMMAAPATMREPDPTRTQLDGVSGTTRRVARRYVKNGTNIIVDRSKMRQD
jgi:hypothetical protein